MGMVQINNITRKTYKKYMLRQKFMQQADLLLRYLSPFQRFQSVRHLLVGKVGLGLL